MHRSHLLLPTLLSIVPALCAQDQTPHFRAGIAAAGGSFDYRTDGSPLDGNTDAGLFRLEFEATGARGIGGGIRLEGIGSNDDLFVDAGFTPREARDSSLFLHFTYRLEEHRFAMPMRAGLRLGGLVLEDKPTGDEIKFRSIGPYFEIAPEVTLTHSESVNWSIYGELGFGAAVTRIDVDGDSNHYTSSTGFFGLEVGSRVLLGPIELGLAYVGRWQSMEQSDPEGGNFIFGYDANFQGLLLSLAVLF